ncbi:MAG: tRNA pseudouridine(38-40) synthase TruA [Candidatus Omnitrophica bacterium]|nr:tRNA pseudouridine(38-40) synthase TruA [Candidatus Omnitrophota bacterium]
MNRAPERILKLILAYEGTRFAGWQRQKAKRTVQATLEYVFQKILNERVGVVGAGRTDSGVHAQGQVAHVKIDSPLPAKIIHRALNALLPEDIVVHSVRLAADGFHARYGAISKWYRYTIWNQPDRPLFDRATVLHIRQPLDLRAMQRAARALRGRRDFKAFHSSGRPVASTRRTLHSLTVRSNRGVIWIDAKADGFLYHMVRRITGLLIETGKGKTSLIPPTAPAKGLCLMKVRYV